MRIVDALEEQPNRIMEIGPGPGVLTEILLANKYLSPKFVEVDPRMVEHLRETFSDIGDQLIQSDVLRLDWAEVFDSPFQIVGNFPYNISTQIVFKMLDYRDQIPTLVECFSVRWLDEFVLALAIKLMV